jgi:hypothetical protein
MLSSSLMAQPPICYEHILRAIGQGLESLSLEAFDLEVVDDSFSIQGTPTRKESEKPTIAPLNAFKKAFLSICHASKKSAPSSTSAGRDAACLQLRFTQADIDRLERDGQAQRSNWERSPLSHSLPQVLRTVGWYVDHKKGELKKLSSSGEMLTVTYIGLLGTHKVESLTLLQIYDMWVHLYKRRKGHIEIGSAVSSVTRGDV